MTEKFSPPNLNYGQTIEILRKERGMTRDALAEASGVSASYLSEVERGFKRPSTDVLAKVAKAFGMLPSRLLEYVESLAVGPPAAAARMEPSRIRREWASLGSRVESVRPSAVPKTQDDHLKVLAVVAEQLSEDDLKILIELARRLLTKIK